MVKISIIISKIQTSQQLKPIIIHFKTLTSLFYWTSYLKTNMKGVSVRWVCINVALLLCKADLFYLSLMKNPMTNGDHVHGAFVLTTFIKHVLCI